MLIYFILKLCQANQYPWVVLLKIMNSKGFSTCGGTLVASKYIITAAHCVHGHYSGTKVKAKDIKVHFINIICLEIFSH